MGLLTDYFAATASELEGVPVEDGPFLTPPPPPAKPKGSGGIFGLFRSNREPVPVVEAPPTTETPTLPAFASKGIDAHRIALLDSLLTGIPFGEEDWNGPATTPIRRDSEDSRWIFALRPEFRDAIAVLDDNAASALAARWAADTDWMGDTDPESVQALREFIADLRELARTAAGSGRDLYLWVCL
jgi:hypothetical protein